MCFLRPAECLQGRLQRNKEAQKCKLSRKIATPKKLYFFSAEVVGGLGSVFGRFGGGFVEHIERF